MVATREVFLRLRLVRLALDLLPILTEALDGLLFRQAEIKP